MSNSPEREAERRKLMKLSGIVHLRSPRVKKAIPDEREALIQEGRNQVLYLMLCIGDENVAHDHWHPEKAEILLEARREIVKRLKHPRKDGRDGVNNTFWPLLKPDGTRDWPDFENYTYCPG